MYGRYVHIKAVEVQEEMSNMYIFVLYAPIMFVKYYLAERSLRYHVKRELPKHKNCERTNG